MQQKTGFLASRVIKILTIIVAITVFIGMCAFHFLSAKNHITKLDVSVIPPMAAHFADDKSAILMNDAPDANNNRDIIPATGLRISYDYASGPGAPAFNTNISRTELAQNIKISPAIRGTWGFSNPYTLVFTPDGDWPAATKFNVKIGKKIFSRDVQPNRRHITFKTAPIHANVDLFNIYPAPDGERAVVGVAVISFNYPIQTRDFTDKVSMSLGGEKLDFEVKLDRYMRTAIIRTAPIDITDRTRILRLKLNRIYDADGKSHTNKITARATIDSADNFFKIKNLSSITADDKYGNPQQLILIDMTSAVAEKTDWNKYIDVYLLPRNADNDEDTTEPHTWNNDEITSDVIQKSEQIKLTQANFVNPVGTYQYAFAYDVSDNVPRYLYVTIKPDIKSANGFVAQNGISRVISVAYPERSVKIMGHGALLSLAGDKKLALVARGGVDTAYVNLYKIESDSINHLITQTYNLFSDLEFRAPWIFDAYDMASVFQKKIPFSDTAKNRVNYAALNLGEYLDRTYSDKTGIFIIKTGASENAAEYGDARLILLTNLGIIRKINLDRSSVVFVSYLSDGTPAADIDINVLGRNGYPIWAGITDATGRVDIPRFSADEYRNEKEPVAIVARHDSDVSFIPYYADMAQAGEYSKFDIGGTYSVMDTPLKSFVFSDRGIYRPGETLTIGAIIENKTFTPVSNVPVKIEISDPRGRTIMDRKISVPSDGMIDITHKLTTDAPLGQYEVNIYTLNSRGHIQDSIGTGNFMVQEFVPDTMKINARLDNASSDGWISPDKIHANVSLNNMYGTPATNRRVSAHATLRPIDFTFSDYKNYKFTSNFNSKSGMAAGAARSVQTFTVDSADARTDENGNAEINIDFNREIPVGTYMLNLTIRGFEAGDGKSIQTIINSRVSNLSKLIGYKTESDLMYLGRNSTHSIKLIAIDSDGHAIDADDITMKLIRRENLTSLLKDYDNHYKYQTTSHDVIVAQSQISISKNGSDIKLNTSNGGTYYIQLLDSNDNILANIEYFVAADENTEPNSDSRAELQIKLDAASYKPGDTINIGITAPYTGTGLITIERDRVYAHRWFVANTTSSTQKITLPPDFEGTGYVNVSFVRDINSRDIFTTPYTYAVAPFSTNIDKHKINVKLNAPKTIHDNKLPIEITTDIDSRVMLFAVNTGILQVANYSIPNPLKYFFQKAALQVETYQILSLLLPEFNVLREVAKIGGGDYNGDFGGLDTPLTNPFGRKTLPPVAFYSGIIDTTANTPKTVKFDIPEYFNGAVSVYAVSAAPGRVGAADTAVNVQSPVIISVSAPAFVAPNDKFTVNTIISNLTQESGTAAMAQNNAIATGQILPIEKSSGAINLPENTERLWTFDATASDIPGTGTISVSTTLFDSKNHPVAARRTSHELSVRPAAMMRTEIRTDVLNSGRTTIKNPNLGLYDSGAVNTLYISKSPAVLARPMFMYLANYDFDCTEQLISRTLPYVVAPENEFFGTTRAKSDAIVIKTIQTLSNRQNADGSFGMWSDGASDDDNDPTAAYLTAYAVNFLTMARNAGFNVPQSMFARATDFLRTYAGERTTSVADAHAKAFTIYVLSLNDYVTTSYIDLLNEYMDENLPDWSDTIIGAYIAASYKMLKQSDKAFNLVSKYKSSSETLHKGMFNNPVASDAMYVFISRKYFDTMPERTIKFIQEYINAGDYDSFTAAAIVVAMSDTTSKSNIVPETLSVSVDGSDLPWTVQNENVVWQIPNNFDKLRINCSDCKSKNPAFFSLVSMGFPRTVRSESNGIEISREYYDANGARINSGHIGDIVDVKIIARTRGGTSRIDNAVISDLLPGGFMPISDSVSGNMEFNEIREDRVLIFAPLSRDVSTFTYRAQLTAGGEFTVPPVTVMDMYNSSLRATGETRTFTVSNAKD